VPRPADHEPRPLRVVLGDDVAELGTIVCSHSSQGVDAHAVRFSPARPHAPGKPHLGAACLNAGDCMSASRTVRNAPGLPTLMPPRGGPGGGVLVGSGKSDTP
jgi:hypothetical protein